MHACRFGHQHDDKLDVLLCLTTAILEKETTMTESIDQGFTDLSSDLDAFDASEQKELAFLQDLENARGAGQLAPDQQATLDALRARIQGEAALLDAADAPVEPAAPVDNDTNPVDAPVDSTPVEEPAPAA